MSLSPLQIELGDSRLGWTLDPAEFPRLAWVSHRALTIRTINPKNGRHYKDYRFVGASSTALLFRSHSGHSIRVLKSPVKPQARTKNPVKPQAHDKQQSSTTGTLRAATQLRLFA